MGTLKLLGALVSASALAGCGGDSPPQLVDRGPPADLPAELAHVDDAVMTRVAIAPAGEVEGLDACGLPPASDETDVVKRIGVHGSSLTFVGEGASLHGCNAIPNTPEEPDRPYGGIWCSGAVGRQDPDGLSDPRLSLCQNTSREVTAFVWIEPEPDTKWVVVSDAGLQEVYEVAAGLPVRVTMTGGAELERSRASFDIEEYAADGTKLRDYALEAAVAG